MVHYAPWIVRAPNCTIRYVSDGRYLPRGEAPEVRNLRKQPRNNIVLYQTKSASRITSFRSYTLLAIRAMRRLRDGEDLFADYDSSYQFKW